MELKKLREKKKSEKNFLNRTVAENLGKKGSGKKLCGKNSDAKKTR